MSALYSTGKPCRATIEELSFETKARFFRTQIGVLDSLYSPVCMHTWRKKFDSANKAAEAKARTEKKSK